MTVHIQAGVLPFEVVGIARFGDIDSRPAASVVGFTFSAAQANIAEPGKVDSISASPRTASARRSSRDRSPTWCPTTSRSSPVRP